MNAISANENNINIVIEQCGAFSMLGALHKVAQTLEVSAKRIRFYLTLLPYVNLQRELQLIEEHYKDLLPRIDIFSFETYNLHFSK